MVGVRPLARAATSRAALRTMPVGSPVFGSRSIFPRWPSSAMEAPADAAELERQRVQRGIGAGAETHGIARRRLVQLLARG